MMAMERQKIEMEADSTDMLIIYEEAAMEAAIPAAAKMAREKDEDGKEGQKPGRLYSNGFGSVDRMCFIL